MEEIMYKMEGHILRIGNHPQLVINLDTQENYIQTDEKEIPYRKTVEISPDLLEGKRKPVMKTAIRYYYQQACQIADDMKIAEEYWKYANLTIREK